jgi:hypothetical protein
MKGALGFDPRAVAELPPTSAAVLPRGKPGERPPSAASAASAAAAGGKPAAGGAACRETVRAIAAAAGVRIEHHAGVAVLVAELADGRIMATRCELLEAALPALPPRLRMRLAGRLAFARRRSEIAG